MQKTTIASLATLTLGAIATVTALVHAGGFSALLNRFALLAVIPYLVFCGACILADSSPGRAIATLVVCVLAAAMALLYYGDLIFLHPGSMSGLVFLFVPLFQLPAAVLLLVVMFFARVRRRSSPAT